jgi:hypothetical protein
MTEHERWVDAAGAYVLGAMPEGERRRYEGHLVDCAICRDEVDELRPAAEALPVASAPMRPSPELKARIMAEVEREAALLAQAGPEADRPPAPQPRRRRSWLSGWRLAPVAATVLACGVLAGFVIAGLGGGTDTFRGTIENRELAGASVEVQVKDGDEAVLVADNLPPLEEDEAYMTWVLPKGEGAAPEPGQQFLARNGEATVAVPNLNRDTDAAVLVTRETERDPTTPSEPPVMAVPLAQRS